MKKLRIFLVLFFGIILFTISTNAQVESNLRNIMLLKSDLPSGTVVNGGESSNKMPEFAGWQPNPSAVVQGIAHAWKIENRLYYYLKYGYLDNPTDANVAARNAIFHSNTLLVHFWPAGSFSGTPIGDHVFHWDMQMETGWINPNYPGDGAKLSFCKGNYAALIHVGDESLARGALDKIFLENLAKKIEKKIDVATSLDNFGTDLPNLITQQGILRSLQAKLDAFTKHYRKGDYRPALNEINAFVNELSAQRGKHVSEQGYQKLKADADTIVNSLNSLM